MQVSSISNEANFKGLDLYKVRTPKAWELIRKERSRLEKLGKEYDITVSSEYDLFGDNEYITAEVKNLGEKPSFLKRIFSNKWKGTADTTTKSCHSVVYLVERAITDLNKDAIINKMIEGFHESARKA